MQHAEDYTKANRETENNDKGLAVENCMKIFWGKIVGFVKWVEKDPTASLASPIHKFCQLV